MARKSLFYRIYFMIIGVFFVLLAAGLCLLYAWLGAYEPARPATVIQTMHADYIRKGDLYALKEKGGLKISPYETERTLNAAFGSIIEGKELALQADVAKRSGPTRGYIVTADGEPLLTIQLRQQKTGGRLGVKPYVPAGAALAEKYYHAVTITAPSNAEISVNGIALEKETPAEQAVPEVLRQKEGEAALAVPQTYTLEHFLSAAPEITAAGEAPFTVTGENGAYSIRQTLDAGAEKQIQDFALLAAQTYAAHMQNDAPLRKVAEYVDTETAFYKNIQSSMVMFAWEHNGYAFEASRCGEVYAYSDALYRCRVSFTQVLYLGSKTYRDPFDQYVYLCKTAGGWKVIDMQQYAKEQ